jgi:hypothetical protein
LFYHANVGVQTDMFIHATTQTKTKYKVLDELGWKIDRCKNFGNARTKVTACLLLMSMAMNPE